ncbi:cyclin-D-binding Myb-like transcription factor 1 isoform X2 [Liolophura sinensis]|uniref:cyclin-D-binding Myb-like transcription factor 1 isoform X2 n=1 Tax=Liolophura sinensis TaxID=3198878 RepID=UPI00315899C7
MEGETSDEGNCDFGDIGITQTSAIEAGDNSGGTVTSPVCPAAENFEPETDPPLTEVSNQDGVKSAAESASLSLSSQSAHGPHFIILTDGEQAGTVEVGDIPLQKRIKLEGENQTFYVTVPANSAVLSDQLNSEDKQGMATSSKQGGVVPDGVTQAWFTTRDDKMAIRNQGVTWKQGHWTKDEVELLQSNISDYCQKWDIPDPTDIIFKTSKEQRKDFYRTVARGLQRPLFSVYRRVIRMYDQKNHIGKYSSNEMEQLRDLRRKHGADWALIGAALGRSASSVKDKCRLMNDRCNSGKWLPEEEKRLAAAVYELTGCQAGESITHGLSWSLVAEKVGSRSEKQCRTKWLNFLNWKVKGGTEWTREDDINLVLKISQLGVTDETEIDWLELAKNWSSVRSPQWLRGKWWSLKRHVQDYQMLPFREVVECLRTMHLAVRLKSSNGLNMRVARVEAPVPRLNLPAEMSTRLPQDICVSASPNSGSVLSSEGTSEGDSLHAYEVLHQLTPTSSGTFLITQPNNNPAISLTGNTMTTDHIIVHTLPVNNQGNNNVAVQLNNPRVIIDSSEEQVTSLDSTNLTNAIQLAGNLVQQDSESNSFQVSLASSADIQQTDLEDTDLQLNHQGEIIHVALNETQGELGQSALGDIENTPAVTSDLVLVSSASPQYVQAGGTEGRLLSSLADPMLTSQSVDLICTTSDMDGEKSQVTESDMPPIET